MNERLLRIGIGCLSVLSFCGVAGAQVPGVVQLPSFQRFSYQGSVLVPDQGATSLGGIKRYSAASRNRGTSRSFGHTMSHANASVHATIIDLDAMDRQLLGDDFRVGNEHVPERFTAEHCMRAATALVRLARRQLQDGQRSLSATTYASAIAQLNRALQLADSDATRNRASSLLAYATAERKRSLPTTGRVPRSIPKAAPLTNEATAS